MSSIPEALKQQIESLPLRPGVYIYKDRTGKVLYVGKSVRLRDRVRSYFVLSNQLGPKTTKMVESIVTIDHIETESEIEALLLESELIKLHKPPFNVQWKDDKRYKFIVVEHFKVWKKDPNRVVQEQIWPEVTTSRKRDHSDSMYFGPFPEGKTTTNVLKSLRTIFPWCKYSSAEQAKRAGRACFYSHINRCPGICNDEVTLTEYWQTIEQLVLFLQGKRSEVQEFYQEKMETASAEQDFEAAAKYRDVLQRMEYVTQQFRGASEYMENPNLIEDVRAEELTELLEATGIDPHKDPTEFYIEGYDISNMGKDYTTASRVAFIGGQPEKSLYRRYKIKTEKLPDDYAAMQEVLTRRFRKKDDLPDLILIDGGKGQLGVALDIRAQMDVDVRMIGLAKREEIIIVPRNGVLEEVTLPHSSAAIKLIQRVRDESHRFAKNYHKHLRNKGFVNK